MAGRKRKPTVMKKLENNPGRRPLPEDEPQPDIGDIPDPPELLQGPALEKWNEMSEKLHRLGLLTEIDHDALAMYCQFYGRWQEAEELIKKSGLMIKTTNGNVVQSPLVGTANRAAEICHRILVEFGMTPSSRSKAKVEKPKTKSKFGEYGVIKGGKK